MGRGAGFALCAGAGATPAARIRPAAPKQGGARPLFHPLRRSRINSSPCAIALRRVANPPVGFKPHEGAGVGHTNHEGSLKCGQHARPQSGELVAGMARFGRRALRSARAGVAYSASAQRSLRSPQRPANSSCLRQRVRPQRVVHDRPHSLDLRESGVTPESAKHTCGSTHRERLLVYGW